MIVMTGFGLEERDKEVKNEVLNTNLYTRRFPFLPHNLGSQLSHS